MTAYVRPTQALPPLGGGVPPAETTRSSRGSVRYATPATIGTTTPPSGSGSSDDKIPGASADPVVFLLDTTVLIDALRGRPVVDGLLALRRTGDVPYISAVNAEEVVRRIRGGEEERALAFLRGFRVAPLLREQGEVAGRWRREFAARGVTLSQADCLVAAAAAGVGATLATGNPRDFPMRDVHVEHWPVGTPGPHAP